MEDKCCFDMATKCSILMGRKNCEGCKFYKTAEQFEAERIKSEKKLAEKGLVAYFDGVTVGVRKVGG